MYYLKQQPDFERKNYFLLSTAYPDFAPIHNIVGMVQLEPGPECEVTLNPLCRLRAGSFPGARLLNWLPEIFILLVCA